ncbi:MAG TPA: GntR family transcriptional regulator [Burkholderiaceae bacterium]|nr:GntR family transcriptional regulator [Burkholderiaceae bacterium]
MNAKDKRNAVTAQDFAYRFIKEEILCFRLQPNEHLSALELANRLEISRTPIREALSRLEQDGLVTKGGSGGFYVRPISLKEIVDAYRIREVLEVQAALEALPNVDDALLERLRGILAECEALLDPDKYVEFLLAIRRFQAEIVVASGNGFFEQVMTPIIDRARLVGGMLIRVHAPRQRQVYDENVAIFEALEKRDAALVEATVRRHVQNAREQVVKLLTNDTGNTYLGASR